MFRECSKREWGDPAVTGPSGKCSEDMLGKDIKGCAQAHACARVPVFCQSEHGCQAAYVRAPDTWAQVGGGTEEGGCCCSGSGRRSSDGEFWGPNASITAVLPQLGDVEKGTGK